MVGVVFATAADAGDQELGKRADHITACGFVFRQEDLQVRISPAKVSDQGSIAEDDAGADGTGKG